MDVNFCVFTVQKGLFNYQNSLGVKLITDSKILKKGTLFLIPNTLGDAPIENCLPPQITEIIENCGEFIVEDARNARRFIKKSGASNNLDTLIFHLLNKHTNPNAISTYLKSINNGVDIGILSEAGCPAIADPGAQIVKIAHQKSIKIVPLVGPSSILLSLIASGFNGQNFSFHGYLPIENSAKAKKIRQLENDAHSKNQTQIFIETPYRNEKLLAEIIKICSPNTQLCIACNITLQDEFIKTATVQQWKKSLPKIHKKPTVFLIFRE